MNLTLKRLENAQGSILKIIAWPWVWTSKFWVEAGFYIWIKLVYNYLKYTGRGRSTLSIVLDFELVFLLFFILNLFLNNLVKDPSTFARPFIFIPLDRPF